jgi:hypothetical protein
MAGKRKEAEQFIIKYVEKILPGGVNRAAYEKLFQSMNDEEFESWIKKIEQGGKICIIAPNQSEVKIELERNYAVARELGHNFFERVWMDGKAGSPPYLSGPSYLVFDLPIRRQAQIQIKKVSIPESTNVVDNLTGQPVGPSKGSKISYPELQILASRGLDKITEELIKFRGGDRQGFQAMNDSIARTGQVRLDAIEHLASGVESTKTLYTYLICMHLQNTLLAK